MAPLNLVSNTETAAPATAAYVLLEQLLKLSGS